MCCYLCFRFKNPFMIPKWVTLQSSMSEASSSSDCNYEKRSKHRISFLLNPEPRSPQNSLSSSARPLGTGGESSGHEEISISYMTPEPPVGTSACLQRETLKISMTEDDRTSPMSPFEMTSSATRICSVQSVLPTSDDVRMGEQREQYGTFVGVTGESPNHETDRYVYDEVRDGTRHISLINGELINCTDSGRIRGRRRKRGNRILQTNLQQKRASVVSRADTIPFSRRTCCKRLGCFQRLDEDILRACVKETLLMSQVDRRRRLRSWLLDGVFFFSGRRVCSAFLAAAFGFSRDLQRSIKKRQAAEELAPLKVDQ